MITLKDIKVSKVRIPVQNAIWLRPTGNKTYKIYYPRGGDWGELPIEGVDPKFKEDIENSIKSIEDEIKSLSDKLDTEIKNRMLAVSGVSSLQKMYVQQFSERIKALEEEMAFVLENLPKYDTVHLNDSFSDLQYGRTSVNPDAFRSYGFTQQAIQAIESGDCTKALIFYTNQGAEMPYTLEASGTQEATTLHIVLTPTSNIVRDGYEITMDAVTDGQQTYITYKIDKYLEPMSL